RLTVVARPPVAAELPSVTRNLDCKSSVRVSTATSLGPTPSPSRSRQPSPNWKSVPPGSNFWTSGRVACPRAPSGETTPAEAFPARRVRGIKYTRDQRLRFRVELITRESSGSTDVPFPYRMNLRLKRAHSCYV